MLFICQRDNGEGKSYSFDLDYQPKMWRDGSKVKIKGDYGEVHTAVFGFAYQAALYIHFVDYSFNKEPDILEYDENGHVIPDRFAGEMGQCFRSDLWGPDAKNTGWGFIYEYLIWKKEVDIQVLKDYVIKRANERWRQGGCNIIILDGSFSWSFLEYVIKAMKDVGHVEVKDDKIRLTDTAGER